MSRMQSTQVKPTASNNVYTAIVGSAFVVSLLSLVLIYMRWADVSNEKLFGVF